VLADIGRRVAELRRERKWVQAELAERMDVTLRHIQRIEAGEKNLTVRSLVLLAHVLRTHPTEFLSQPLSRARRTAGRPRKNAG
jgi:transcriptional regulator with XRE-family HTH domain